MNKKDRAQRGRNVRYRLWRAGNRARNGLDGLLQWLFKRVMLPVGALNRWPRVAHFGYRFRPHLTCGMVGGMWATHWLDHGAWWAVWSPQIAFFAALWLSLVGDVHVTPHGQMCSSCLDESFPVNGEALAEAKMERLRFYHFKRQKWQARSAWLFIPWMITLIGYGWFVPWYGQLVAWSAIMMVGVWMAVYAERPHRRLRYWCPWCRENDGALAPEPELDRSA